MQRPHFNNMNIRTPFINEYGRPRSGWRLLLFIAVSIALYFLLGTVVRIGWAIFHATGLRVPHEGAIADLISRILLLVIALTAGYICARFLEGLPWRSLGLTFHHRWLRDFLVGSLIGLLSLAFAVVIASIAGGFSFTFSGFNVFLGVAKSLLGSLALFVVAALAEEAVFRGYPLQTLCRAHLSWLGVLLTLLLFASAHLGNPNAALFPFINTSLAGIWLAIAYLRTRSLWLPLGVHWAWNWALGSLFGLPVSGITLVSHPLIQGKDLGPTWITGGNYGIEGGAACTVALVVSSIFMWRTRIVSATPELLKLTSEERPTTPPDLLSIRPTGE